MQQTQQEIARVCDRVKNLLLEKNMKYGDSALNPIRIMSQASNIEQILVRIDDKLNRLKQGDNLLFDDEDVIMDLIGYYVLLKVAIDRDSIASYNNENPTT
jgi:hypothetical protein